METITAKSNARLALGVFGRTIVAALIGVILYLSLSTIFATFSTEKIGVTVWEYDSSGVAHEVKTYLYEDKDFPDELKLEEPEIMKQGGRYGVRLKASAPSIHMIRADIATTVSPIVGNEKQSEDMVNYLLQEFEGDTGKLWQSNIFGRSFHEIVGDDLQAKLRRMPQDSQKKLREALERIINDGSGGLICIIL